VCGRSRVREMDEYVRDIRERSSTRIVGIYSIAVDKAPALLEYVVDLATHGRVGVVEFGAERHSVGTSLLRCLCGVVCLALIVQPNTCAPNLTSVTWV
jgi:hypothetical protein